MSTEAAAQTKPTKLSGKDLKDAIKRQVEFYFSRANLANDAFLVSQMNSQMFVPVETIVGFGKIKQLTSNPSLVVEAIQDSKVVVLNETKDAIKPNIKSERNTIILREIPSATKPEDVQAIFEGCEGEISVRSDVGDTWFVTLASEDAAVKTLLELRNKTFHGAPIKARLKSENVLKSFFPAQTVVEPVATGGAYSRGYYAAGGNGYYDVAANYGPQYASGPRGQYAQGNGAARGRQQQPRQQNGAGRGANGAKEGRAKSNSFDQQQPRPASRKAKDKKNKAAAADKQTPAGAKKGAAAASAAAPASAERQPVLNSANFPPLPASDKPAGSPYGEIKFSYAHEDILEIVKHMDDDDCKLPSGKMDFEAHAVALTPVAHPDLLRNQRTYSIEQAREALRQGRPIRSDSIGSIDYESMMYGEDYTKEARELRKQKAEAAPPAAATGAAPAAATPSAAAPTPAQPKVVGYAAALIYGTPAPQPPVEAKKKAAPAATAAAAAPGTAPAAAGAKGKAAKGAKGDEKKAPKKKEQQPVVDETLPKAGAWGGRAFAEVVKSEPVNPPPAPAKAPAPAAATATSASPSATAKTAERKNSDGKWERNQKDRRPVGGDKQ